MARGEEEGVGLEAVSSLPKNQSQTLLQNMIVELYVLSLSFLYHIMCAGNSFTPEHRVAGAWGWAQDSGPNQSLN